MDMMGYVVHRTYITIRPKIFLRARRAYLRAAAELERTGRIRLFRCYRITSYYGPFKQSDSRKAQENLHVQELVKIAKQTIAAAARKRAAAKKGLVLP